VESIGAGIFHLDELVGGPTLLVSPDGVVLVDAGLPGVEDELFAALESLGASRSELRHVLITHADGDHVGSLAAIVAQTGAAVWAPPGEADIVEGKQPTRRGDLLPGTPVERLLSPGEIVPLHGGIEVVGTPGHTANHVSFFLPEAGVLLAGDCLNNVDGLAGSMPQFTNDPEQARETVQTVAALGPRSVCFGHGPSLVGDAADQLQALAAGI
jgi:glyoxylase-like metal-dependent hydrolase (beta-lactamase superfamily II)